MEIKLAEIITQKNIIITLYEVYLHEVSVEEKESD